MGRAKDPKTGLTEQQLKFTLMLRSDPERIVSKAYRAAYPSCKSVRAAETNGSALMRNHKVRLHLQKMDKKDLAKFDVTVDNVNREKSAIAFFDIRKIFTDDGALKHPQDLDDASAAAIASIEVEAKATGHGEDREIVVVSKVKFHNKVQVLDQLSRQLGQYEKDNDQKSGGMAELIAAVDGNTRGLPPPDEDGE